MNSWMVSRREGTQNDDLLEESIEQVVVFAAVGDELETASHQLCAVDLFESIAEHIAEDAFDLIVVECTEERGDTIADPAGGALAVGGEFEEIGDGARRREVADLALEVVDRQQPRLDEVAEVGTDLILLARDDGGVPDGNTERVAEERDDGEPVGEGADHGSFGEGADVVPANDPDDGAIAERMGHGEEHGHEHERSGGDELHPPERTNFFLGLWSHLLHGHSEASSMMRVVEATDATQPASRGYVASLSFLR